MNLYMENETEREFPFSTEDTARLVCEAVLEAEGCPYEAQVNVLLTDDRGIREMNREYRGIDRETDVLSFPNVDFEEEGVFDIGEDSEADYFDPETGELVLGDIMISVDRVYGQAEEYGHSVRREFAFLVAHSMLHLCGYDHMEEEERARMERRQEEILTGLGITRD
ncbi:rRNA maturation RNase YbeY [uncultured Acetatifactor sp.]|jgi:probable rRNA maturation factor|uniref:rRNA maturation RNase YbeY n=1 Tax=uncultured Acetatifactor sp. TaxID=1671927 RepID=UPI002610AD68|nr:rRNA maturation RNase YbeY [uncultured Acetatifactor sp.]